MEEQKHHSYDEKSEEAVGNRQMSYEGSNIPANYTYEGFNKLHPDKQKFLALGYSDIASEIKFLRQVEQKKFNLTNEFSKKKLHQT